MNETDNDDPDPLPAGGSCVGSPRGYVGQSQPDSNNPDSNIPDSNNPDSKSQAFKGQNNCMVAVDVDVQWQIEHDSTCPEDEEIQQWVRLAIESERINSESINSESGFSESVDLKSVDLESVDSERSSAESIEAGNPAVIFPESNADSAAELTVRIVDSQEMQSANRQWRNIDKSTNVLSFPSDFPPEIGLIHYGDMLVCAEVLAAESAEQGKSAAEHWAHIVIHGTLHLLGYDHIDAAEATVMERREIEILATLGIGNPYLTVGDTEISVSEVSKS